MILKEALIQSLSFAVRDSRSLTCAAHVSAFLWKEMVGADSGAVDIAEKASASPQIYL